jgi:hypothetical protein
MTYQMIARLNYRGNYTLDVDGVRFGTLFLRGDGAVSGGSFVDDDVATEFGALIGMPCDTVEQALARSRRAYELALANRAAQ